MGTLCTTVKHIFCFPLQTVRRLAREQYMNRALAKKVGLTALTTSLVKASRRPLAALGMRMRESAS